MGIMVLVEDRKIAYSTTINIVLRGKHYNEIDSGIGIYHKMKELEPKKNECNDAQRLSSLAHALREGERMEVAMKAFKLAVSKFPESPNAFDSLVETYFTNHEYDVAFSSYKKALKFNLNYFNAVGASELIENINGKLATTQYYIYNG